MERRRTYGRGLTAFTSFVCHLQYLLPMMADGSDRHRSSCHLIYLLSRSRHETTCARDRSYVLRTVRAWVGPYNIVGHTGERVWYGTIP